MHAAERKSYATLVEHLRTTACSDNQLLIGAGFLAMRKQWASVNDLREKLLAVRTPRAVDLAARSALEAGQNADAIEILDKSTNVFPDDQLNDSLLYLRARANDHQGLKGLAIADLETADRARAIRLCRSSSYNRSFVSAA